MKLLAVLLEFLNVFESHFSERENHDTFKDDN